MRPTEHKGEENEEGSEAGEGNTQAAQLLLLWTVHCRKKAPWKEELVEGSSHLVSKDVTSDLLPSSPPAWPSPTLRVAGLGIVGWQHPGAFQSWASYKRWVWWGIPRREEVGLLTWGMGAGIPHQ